MWQISIWLYANQKNVQLHGRRNNMNDLKRLPSQEKPWLKFFSEEAINATPPKKTIYSYMREKNEGFEKNTAINFFGNKISYGEFLGTVDGCAASFAALGVGKGEGASAARPCL